MRRRGEHLALLIVIASIAMPSIGCPADAPAALEQALNRRFPAAGIELQGPGHLGAVVRKGKVLTVIMDGAPAKPFHVMRADPRSANVHVMDFARIEVTADAGVHADPAPLVMPKGTRVVVLGVRVSGDRVHFLTHSTEPLPTPWRGSPAYGCTEFTFHVPATVLAGGDAKPLFQLIERWLAWTPDERLCAPDDPQLCLEP